MTSFVNDTVKFLDIVRSNHTNGTSLATPATGDCDQTALTAGSAAFILIALILGCMTQPAGSLVTHTSNRFWRISPFLNALESLIIYGWLLVPSIDEICTCIRRRLPHSYEWHLTASERVGDMSLKVAAYVALVQRLANSRKHDYWAKGQYDGQNITSAQIETLTDQVQHLERGATLRPAIILPMILQFLKIMFIGAGFVWKVWPLIYFFSWLSVELLLLIIHGSPLTEEELNQVKAEVSEAFAVTEVQGYPPLRRMTPAPTEMSTAPGDAAQEASASSTAEEGRGLLQSGYLNLTRPKHRIYFRTKRRSLKTIQGNPSAGFILIALGRVAVTLESYCHMLPILLWVEMSSGWHIFLYMFLSLGPLVLLDLLGGFVVLAIQIWWMKPEDLEGAGALAGMRDLVAFKTAIIWIVYYLCIYSSEGMVKPGWLDWLG